MTTSKNMPNGWTRPAVTFRLSPRRRQDLLALCGEDADSLTPTAALDLAISLARDNLGKDAKKNDGSMLSSASFGNPDTSRVPLGGDLISGADRQVFDELSSQLCEERQELRDFLIAQTSRSGEILAAIAGRIKELRDTITKVASESDEDSRDDGDGIEETQRQPIEMDYDLGKPILIRDWLELETISLPRSAFVLKAQWQTTRRTSVGNVEIELQVRRIATAGVEGQSGQGSQQLVRLLTTAIEAKTFMLTSELPFYFRCQCNGQKTWLLKAHQVSEDGQLGEPLLSVIV